MSSRMRIVHVDPKKIQIPPTRVTSVWNPEEYEIFKSSLEADGIANPVICVKEGDAWWLADGRHRLEEALLKGWRRIPVAYKEGTLVDAKLRNLYLNRLRGKTKVSEEVALIKDLYGNDGLELADIAKKTGMSLERIEQRLAIGRASEYVQEALNNELIGLGVAFHLSRLPNPKGQDRILAELMKMPRRPTTDWVRKVVDESLQIIEEMKRAPEPPAVGPPIRTITCGFCQQRYEVREMRGVNLCLTCYGMAKDHIRELMKRRARGETPEQILAQRVARATVETG